MTITRKPTLARPGAPLTCALLLLGAAGCDLDDAPMSPPAASTTSEVGEAATSPAAVPETGGSDESVRDIPDDDVADAVRTELVLDRGVNSQRIEVGVSEGIVTLTGTVEHLLGKRRAVRRAEYVKGVRSVVDRIDVRPTGLPDSQVETNARLALSLDPATDDYQLDVRVAEGVARLQGTVASRQAREIVEHVVAGVAGVLDIDDDLAVVYGVPRSDADIRAEVKRQLEIDNRVSDSMIDVAVTDGVVHLSGTVGSAAERRVAANRAWVTGARSVDDDGLEVRWWAANDRVRMQQPRLDDAAVRQAIADAWLYDPRVLSFEPTARVHAGAATLSGQVDNLAAKRAAETDARNTVGVWRVTNLIRVVPSLDSTDDDVRRRVQEALTRDPYLATQAIRVSVNDGEVRLSGDVDTAYQASEAMDVAASVHGVVGVDDALRVRTATPFTSSWEQREQLRDRLRWDPRVDASEVRIGVANGTTTISGQVEDWQALRAVQENAQKLRMEQVVIDLRVKHGGPQALSAGSAS